MIDIESVIGQFLRVKEPKIEACQTLATLYSEKMIKKLEYDQTEIKSFIRFCMNLCTLKKQVKFQTFVENSGIVFERIKNNMNDS